MNRATHKSQALALLAGVGFGAALMYFTDPRRGKARRHMAADRAASRLRDVGHDLDVTRRDVRNHARGVAARIRRQLNSGDDLADGNLADRVRSELGHHVQAMGRLDVTAVDGDVTLSGQLPDEERAAALATARKVRGVRQVHDLIGGVH